MGLAENFIEKLENGTAELAVIGLGYVGLPLALLMVEKGYKTVGVDASAKKADGIASGKSPVEDVTDERLKAALDSGLLTVTTNPALLKNADAFCACVPTPLDAHGAPDPSYVVAAIESAAPYLKKGALAILESTTYPGTTDELVVPILEDGGRRKNGVDFLAAFSPERVDPGNKKWHTDNTPKVVGGTTSDATVAAKALYEKLISAPIHAVSSAKAAELEKLLENTYRNVNIGLVNELARACHAMGVSIWEVVEAASTKPYGFQAFWPGPGLGGHCIPLDPGYLTWKTREYGCVETIVESSMAVNGSQERWCADRATEALNKAGKALNGSKILVLGAAYKGEVSDVRESPALKLMAELMRRGADVGFYDPYVDAVVVAGRRVEGARELTADALENSDLAIVATEHKAVDYGFVADNAKAVLDLKGVTRALGKRDNVELL